MAKAKLSNTSGSKRRQKPSLDPEVRDNQLISYAIDLVEQRLLDGTASSQETTHFLKLATQKSKLENKQLEAQTEMAIAKKELMKSQKRSEELFEEAIKAFKNYSGQGEPDEYEDY